MSVTLFNFSLRNVILVILGDYGKVILDEARNGGKKAFCTGSLFSVHRFVSIDLNFIMT